MQQPRGVHRAECRGHVRAERGGFDRAHRAACLHQLLERLAVHQLHPQARHAVDHVGAVDSDDMLVPDAREHAAFLHHHIGIGHALKQLERDQPLEPGVPGAIHGAVRSAADDVQQIEMAPARPVGHQVAGRVRGHRQQLMQLAMAGGNLREHRELVGHRALIVGRQ